MRVIAITQPGVDIEARWVKKGGQSGFWLSTTYAKKRIQSREKQNTRYKKKPSQSGRLIHSDVVRCVAITPGQF
jgi:hypothetical protein